MIMATYKRMRIKKIHIAVLDSHIAKCSNQNSCFQRRVGKHKTWILNNFRFISRYNHWNISAFEKGFLFCLENLVPNFSSILTAFPLYHTCSWAMRRSLCCPENIATIILQSYQTVFQNLLQTSYKSCRERHGEKDLVKAPLRFSDLCLLIPNL